MTEPVAKTAVKPPSSAGRGTPSTTTTTHQKSRPRVSQDDAFVRLDAKRMEIYNALNPEKTLTEAAKAQNAKSGRRAASAAPGYKNTKPVIEGLIRDAETIATDPTLPPDLLSDFNVLIASCRGLMATAELTSSASWNVAAKLRALDLAAKAADNLRQAITLNPDSAWAWSSLGQSLLGLAKDVPGVARSTVCGKLKIESFESELKKQLPGIVAREDSVRCQCVALTICDYLEKKGGLALETKQLRALAASRVEKWRADPAMKAVVEKEQRG